MHHHDAKCKGHCRALSIRAHLRRAMGRCHDDRRHRRFGVSGTRLDEDYVNADLRQRVGHRGELCPSEEISLSTAH